MSLLHVPAEEARKQNGRDFTRAPLSKLRSCVRGVATRTAWSNVVSTDKICHKIICKHDTNVPHLLARLPAPFFAPRKNPPPPPTRHTKHAGVRTTAQMIWHATLICPLRNESHPACFRAVSDKCAHLCDRYDCKMTIQHTNGSQSRRKRHLRASRDTFFSLRGGGPLIRFI